MTAKVIQGSESRSKVVELKEHDAKTLIALVNPEIDRVSEAEKRMVLLLRLYLSPDRYT